MTENANFPESGTTFMGYRVVVDSNLHPEEIIIQDTRGQHKSTWLRNHPPPSDPEHQAAQDMVDRLLNRSNTLTLDMLQEIIDRTWDRSSQPSTIIVAPSAYREYLKLLSANHRFVS